MAPRAAKDADDAARNRTHAAQAPWQLVVGLFTFFWKVILMVLLVNDPKPCHH